ncbi:unnamed protein product [Spirodela intermedia]|uniref:Uncharacterized protein n=1 Tax=Spirodela intermedia TaxID=51605 RepID=A0A7I8L4F7_SPIIN|nr:unnamed protein product [Spirodela intermedia]
MSLIRPAPAAARGGDRFSFATTVAGGALWVQKLRGSYGYLKRAGRSSPNGEEEGEQQQQDSKGLTEEKGNGSPVLWQAAAPPPGARAQDIARYRQEMMELVRGVPEMAYELSLRDMVEMPVVAKGGAATGEEKEPAAAENKIKNGKKEILRSASMDNGVFQLKMFFPVMNLGKWRRSSGASVCNSKVSPKPALPEAVRLWHGKYEGGEGPKGCYGMRRRSTFLPVIRKDSPQRISLITAVLAEMQ